jgi:hypothetical protein
MAQQPLGQGPPYYRGFKFTLRHTTLGRPFLDEIISTWQHTILTRRGHPCSMRDSNPHSQSRTAAGRRLRPSEHVLNLFHFVMNRNRDQEWQRWQLWQHNKWLQCVHCSVVRQLFILPCVRQRGKWTAMNPSVRSYRAWRMRQLLSYCWYACYLNQCNKALFVI